MYLYCILYLCIHNVVCLHLGPIASQQIRSQASAQLRKDNLNICSNIILIYVFAQIWILINYRYTPITPIHLFGYFLCKKMDRQVFTLGLKADWGLFDCICNCIGFQLYFYLTVFLKADWGLFDCIGNCICIWLYLYLTVFLCKLMDRQLFTLGLKADWGLFDCCATKLPPWSLPRQWP